jgi:hypothetical protein
MWRVRICQERHSIGGRSCATHRIHVGSLVSRKTSTPSMVIVIEFMFFHGDCYGSVSFEDCQVNNASFLFSLYHVSASVVDIQRRLYYVLDFVIVISFSVSDKARGVYLDPSV